MFKHKLFSLGESVAIFPHYLSFIKIKRNLKIKRTIDMSFLIYSPFIAFGLTVMTVKYNIYINLLIACSNVHINLNKRIILIFRLANVRK